MAQARNSKTKPRKKTGAKSKAATPAKKKAGTPKRSRVTQKTIKPILNRTSAVVESVRARFTEPLRRSGEYENIRALIQGQAEKLGSRTFLISEADGTQVSFTELDQQTSRVANLLADHGAKPGNRVAIALPTSPLFAFCLLGAMKAGCVAVPLDPALPSEDLRLRLSDCGATHLIADAWSDAVPSGLNAVFVANAPGNGAVDLQQAMLSAGTAQPQTATPRWWDEAAIAYTNAAGEPRGAILQQRQFLTAARRLAVWLGLGSEQRVYSALPLDDTHAQIVGLFMPLLVGGAAVITREFDTACAWNSVERHRVTTISASPAVLARLTEQELAHAAQPGAALPWPAGEESPGVQKHREDEQARSVGLACAHDISSVRRVICNGGLAAERQLAFEKCFLVPVIDGFSQPETTGIAALNPGNGTRKIGSAGVPVGNKIAVQDDGHAPKPLDEWDPQSLLRMSPAVFPTAEVDEPGEICVWGEIVLREYHNRPTHNPKAFAGGWFHTNRKGRLDRDGYLYLEDKPKK